MKGTIEAIPAAYECNCCGAKGELLVVITKEDDRQRKKSGSLTLCRKCREHLIGVLQTDFKIYREVKVTVNKEG